ncbi:MAG TPA: hypothetical protein EYP90_04150, partial [Chromatiaceae bacterium]|nr:hypothetical protein [Chromatiaceae bacterium]
LTGELQHFCTWKKQQLQTMEQLENWLKQEGLYTSQVQRALTHASLTLKRDHITVAVVGEFSRGKTELINALFFSDHKFRLLPTDAGRTTMCPTEIYQDSRQPPCLRLLPIETRLDDCSLAELKENSAAWEQMPLDIDDSEQLHQALLKIREQKLVPQEVVASMGLNGVYEIADDMERMVSVPAWRLAQINYRHPLLSQGLRILDTPGLNAVASEPELTYEMLPSAQVRLFVVGADTGITQSDMEMWQQLIRQPGVRQKLSVIVVLNKADTLWDELRSEVEIQSTIDRQREEVAAVLNIEAEQVYAISAQKGLLGRVKQDYQLEQRSGIPDLEKHLAHTLVHNRQELIIEQSTETVISALWNIEALISSRLRRLEKQARELQQLSSKSEEAIDQLLRQAQKDKLRYQSSIKAYKQARTEFTAHGKILLEAISPNRLEQIITRARKQMTGAWTTLGLKEAMRQMFEDVNLQMEIASNQSQEMRRLVRTIYRRFQAHHDMRLAEPQMLSMISHQVELNLVHQESEIFRKSPRTALTEQHFAVRRYFQTIVVRVRRIFMQAHGDAHDWLEIALDSLTREIQEHRNILSQQLADLKLSGRSRSMVRQRLTTLDKERQKLEEQLQTLQRTRKVLTHSAPRPNDGTQSHLRVVSSRSA